MKVFIIIAGMLIFLSCGDQGDRLSQTGMNDYILEFNDSMIVVFEFYNESNKNDLQSMNLIRLVDNDTTINYYEFHRNGGIAATNIYSSESELQNYTRHNKNGHLRYKVEMNNWIFDGYYANYTCSKLSEKLFKDGKNYFIKDTGIISRTIPSEASINRLDNTLFAIELANDLKEFSTVGFEPDSLRLLFLSSDRDFYFRKNYGLEDLSPIIDTLNLSKFHEDEKVNVIVHYYGDTLADVRKNWNEINFIVDSITF